MLSGRMAVLLLSTAFALRCLFALLVSSLFAFGDDVLAVLACCVLSAQMFVCSQMIHDIPSTVASLPDVSLGTCPWPTTLTLGRPSFTIAFLRDFRSAVVIPLPANEGPHGIPPSVRPLVSFRDTFFFIKPSLKSPKRQNSDSVGSRQESSNSLNNGWG